MGVLLAAAVLAGPAAAGAPNPLGDSQEDIWNVAKPKCAITQAWQKNKSGTTVTSVSLKGRVWCASVPSNLTVIGTLNLYDLNAPLSGKPVLTRRGSLGPSSTAASFTLAPALTNPKSEHGYESEFLVSFVDNVDFSMEGVSGAPPQCQTHNPPPPDGGPIPPPPPSVDCQFIQSFLIP